MNDAYGEPRFRQTAERDREILLRATAYCAAATQRAHREAIARWATDDDAPFRTESDCRVAVQQEIEILCRALGTWAALPAEHLFPPQWDWGD